MKYLGIALVFALFSFKANAQDKQEKDREAIKKMCGCFEVSFNFAETFEYTGDSTYKPSKVKHASALEYAHLVEDKENKLVIQHLLVAGKEPKEFVIKHWRQDWLYENEKFYTYNHSNKWDFEKKPAEKVKGQWTQKVYQVDDSPRYEGSSSWVHVDGKSYWENTTDAPLPRREYTKRSDYNVTVRGNRQEITKEGWVHDQDNDKIVREEGKEDVLIAQEKGYNVYKRVPESRCKAAQKWWAENKNMWEKVRKNWDKVYAKNQDLKLEKKVEGKALFSHLFKMKPDTKNKEIKAVIAKFVK